MSSSAYFRSTDTSETNNDGKKMSFKGRLDRYVHHVSKKGLRKRTAKPSDDGPSGEPTSGSGTLKRKLEEDAMEKDQKSASMKITASATIQTRIQTRSRLQSLKDPSAKPRRARPLLSDPSSSPPSYLRDTIPPNLILLLIGVNPGLMTGSTGFAYAHPSNLFWRLLHTSGITTIQHPPSDTYRLPELYSVGNTNIVERPTRDASMLSKAEMNAGVQVLEEKIAAQRPEAICLVGKSIWEAVWRVRKGQAIKKTEFRYGWQDRSENMGKAKGDPNWNGSRVFVATTTSGLAATMSLEEKQEIWNELGRWVVKRREEREAAAAAAATGENATDLETTTLSN